VCLPKFIELQHVKKINNRRELGREHFRLKGINYRNKNREKVRNKKRLDEKNRRKEDVLYNLKHSVSSSINQYLQSSKSKKTVDILGCSIQEFKQHLESQFEDWMTWENRGRYTGKYNDTWQIDHKIPISSAKSDEDIYKLNHYSNLQPLCSRLNLEKGNKQN
jgi:5-methylcytosine-specific restriction endonuclease McrA